ncbi:arginase family protein [Thomasclavelia cocleata]|uniref:arginase family protein n=1 Tax=Thomasclavelia cocleata TaxID=69824 RepID=UPI0024307AA8|nr:arginase family protein [Thomasclavelia cocleata]MCI9130977.1 arginase family protein [Thomasclavelia cocleata]
MKKILFVFIPLAFRGNPGSESGPRALKKYLEKNLEYDFSTKVLFFYKTLELDINTSIKTFFSIIEETVKLNYNDYDNIFVIGGNHLSIYPVLNYSLKKGNILSFDAHLDNYSKDDLNHGSFLNFLNFNKNLYYMYGLRDNNQNEIENVSLIDINEIKYNKYSHCDIDLDVLDPNQFPYVGNRISNGISISNFKDILNILNFKDIRVISISEYIPLFDKKGKGKQIILSIIREIIISILED